MSYWKRIRGHRIPQTILAISLLCGASAPADLPGWWSEGSPPAVDALIEPNNHGMARIGQAKWMAKEALRSVESVAPAMADDISEELEEIVDLTAPTTKTADWQDKQKEPLSLGHLKALALPFYNHFNLESSAWVLDQIKAMHGGTAVENTDYWKITTPTANYTLGGYYPWNPATTSAVNKSAATVGQLKAVFGFDLKISPVNKLRSDIVDGYYEEQLEYYTFPGQTLVAIPGSWNLAPGGKITGYWYDPSAAVKVGVDNELEYEVPEDGDWRKLVWREVAEQGGHTVILESINGAQIWDNFLSHCDTPVPNNLSSMIVGSPAAGASLAPPLALAWTNPYPYIQPHMTVEREWYKNGVATGSHGTTYSDTQDGDVMEYFETATNALGSAIVFSKKFGVSDGMAALIAENEDEFAPLIVGKDGHSHMDLFSVENHTATPPSYTRNTALWAAPLVSQLTGAAVWKNNGQVQSYGGVMITPRHVLYCQHSHPAATTPTQIGRPAQIVRFVLADNTVVDAIQTHQVENVGKDLCVALLDRDVSALGVHVAPVAGRSQAEVNSLENTHRVGFAISQGAGRAGGVPAVPISDYPANNKMMAYVREIVPCSGSVPSPYDKLDYHIWGGDSGTPFFILHRGTVYLSSIIDGADVGGSITEINQMILDVDTAAAISTGYTISGSALPSE